MLERLVPSVLSAHLAVWDLWVVAAPLDLKVRWVHVVIPVLQVPPVSVVMTAQWDIKGRRVE